MKKKRVFFIGGIIILIIIFIIYNLSFNHYCAGGFENLVNHEFNEPTYTHCNTINDCGTLSCGKCVNKKAISTYHFCTIISDEPGWYCLDDSSCKCEDNECTTIPTLVNAPWYLNSYGISSKSVGLEIKNNGLDNYYVDNVNITHVRADELDTFCVINNSKNMSNDIKPGNSYSVFFNCFNLTSGRKHHFQGDIIINYHTLGSDDSLITTGNIGGYVG